MSKRITIDEPVKLSPELNILVFRIGQLGDTLITFPFYNALKATYPQLRMTLLHDKHIGKSYVLARELFAGENLFGSFIAYPVGHTPLQKIKAYLAMLPLLLQLRKQRFDLLIDLSPYRKTGLVRLRDKLFFRLAGIKQSMTAYEYYPDKLPEGSPGPAMHEADILMLSLPALGVTPPPEREGLATISFTDADSDEVEAWKRKTGIPSDKRWVGFGIGSRQGPIKMWPLERYIAVGRYLMEKHNVIPVIVGGPEEKEPAEQMIKAIGGGYSSAGQLSVRGSARLLHECSLFIGNDTGTIHMAASSGIPCIGIFSSQTPRGVWSPYGKQHTLHSHYPPVPEGMRKETHEYHRYSLLQTTVEDVCRSCDKYLESAFAATTAENNG